MKYLILLFISQLLIVTSTYASADQNFTCKWIGGNGQQWPSKNTDVFDLVVYPASASLTNRKYPQFNVFAKVNPPRNPSSQGPYGWYRTVPSNGDFIVQRELLTGALKRGLLIWTEYSPTVQERFQCFSQL